MTMDIEISGESVPMGVALEVAAASHRGQVRADNQDRWAARERPDGAVLLLADGMGGMPRGDEAAEVAVAAAAAVLSDSATGADSLAVAIDAAVAAVAVRAQHHASRGDAFGGTTLVVAVVSGASVRLASVGDSRAYLCRAGGAVVLTKDHTVAQAEVDAGRLSPEDARHDWRRNRLLQAVTGDPVDPGFSNAELSEGETLLLCSDGVWEPLNDLLIGEIASRSGPLPEVAAELCRRALLAGSSDNVTVLLARLRR